MNIYFVLYCWFNSAIKLAHTLQDFRIWPNYQKIYVGTNALIYCVSAAQTRWTFRGDIPRKYNVSDNSLFLYFTNTSGIGIFICHGASKCGKKFRAKATIEVHNDVLHVSYNIGQQHLLG